MLWFALALLIFVIVIFSFTRRSTYVIPVGTTTETYCDENGNEVTTTTTTSMVEEYDEY